MIKLSKILSEIKIYSSNFPIVAARKREGSRYISLVKKPGCVYFNGATLKIKGSELLIEVYEDYTNIARKFTDINVPMGVYRIETLDSGKRIIHVPLKRVDLTVLPYVQKLKLDKTKEAVPLNLKIGKYDVDKGQKGYIFDWEEGKKYLSIRTDERFKNTYAILGIKPEKIYISYDSPIVSSYALGHYGDEPIICAQRQTEHPVAGQFYIYSRYARLSLTTYNRDKKLPSNDTPKEEFLRRLRIPENPQNPVAEIKQMAFDTNKIIELAKKFDQTIDVADRIKANNLIRFYHHKSGYEPKFNVSGWSWLNKLSPKDQKELYQELQEIFRNSTSEDEEILENFEFNEFANRIEFSIKKNEEITSEATGIINENTLTIESFDVRPAYRKQGIGSEMLSNIIDFAKTRRLGSIDLDIRQGNKPALKLYQKFGFKPLPRKKGFGVGKMQLQLSEIHNLPNITWRIVDQADTEFWKKANAEQQLDWLNNYLRKKYGYKKQAVDDWLKKQDPKTLINIYKDLVNFRKKNNII